MKQFTQTYHIAAPVNLVWQALVTPKHIAGWGAGPAKMQAKVNTTFRLWGGDIYGKNTVVQKAKRLEQDWYGGKWPKPSLVTITLSAERGGTKVVLTHKHVPDAEASNLRSGWRDYYFGPLKEYVEQLHQR